MKCGFFASRYFHLKYQKDQNATAMYYFYIASFLYPIPYNPTATTEKHLILY